MNLQELTTASDRELLSHAAAVGLEIDRSLDISELLLLLARAHAKAGHPVTSSGTLEILADGFGFLRSSKTDFTPCPQDVYVSPSQIRRFHLSTGDDVSGQVRPPNSGERYFALLRVESVNGLAAGTSKPSSTAAEHKAIYAAKRLNLEHKANIEARLLDLLCPIGKGQRALLLSPPKCRKSAILLALAKAAKRKKGIDLCVLLVGAKPETISEFQDADVGDVFASAFDEPAQRHIQVTEALLEKARTSADAGNDVVVLIDSLTRYASCASLASPASGTNLPSGLSPKGMLATKRLFGTGRNLEEAGSITVIAALRSSATVTDEYLHQELSVTAGAVLTLSRAATEMKCPLPLDIEQCINHDEERFLTSAERNNLSEVRAQLVADNPNQRASALLALTTKLNATKSNKEFLQG